MPFLALLPPALVLPPQAKAKSAPAPAAQPKMDGEWTLAENESDDVAVHIDGAVANMNFLQKKLWKHKLTDALPVYKKIFILTGFANSISFDKETPINIPADSTSGTWTRKDDEKFSTSLQKSADGFVLILKGQDYTLNEHLSVSGDTLTLTTTYVNPKFPDSLTLKQVYKRNDG